MCYPIIAINRGVAQFGRAPRSGRGGRKFKSCHLDQKEAAHSLECAASYLQDLNLRHEAPNAQHLAETVRGTVSQRVPYVSVLDYSFLPVEQPECPASFFVCLQDLNLRHEAPNAKHLAETVQGTVSQQVPYIAVTGCLFFSSGAALFFGVAVLVAVLGNARYRKKPDSFDLLGQACGLGRLNLCPVP